MYFKNLYLKKAGKRFTRDYLESPIEFNLFSKIVEEVPNINFNSIRNLYYNYSKVLFPEIISKNYSAHSKYFWKFTCLGLTSKSSSLDQYWIERG